MTGALSKMIAARAWPSALPVLVAATLCGVDAPRASADLRPLWSRANGQTIPLTAAAGESEFRFFGDTVMFIHEGADERVVYTWELPAVEALPPFGRIRCQVTGAGEEGTPELLPVAEDAVLEFAGEVGQSRSRWEPAGQGKFRMVRLFQIGSEIATLNVTGQLVGKSLVLEMTCDKPLVARCLPGHWGSPDYQVQELPRVEEPAAGEKKKAVPAAAAAPARIPAPSKLSDPPDGMFMRRVDVPFLSEEVRVFLDAEVFASAFSDWRLSNEATPGDYPALSNGSRNLLVARFIYTASKDLRQVLPNIPHPASPYREEVGGRIWFEVDAVNPFKQAYDYVEKQVRRGMSDYMVVLPTWQNKGPAAGLPTHFPAMGDADAVAQLEELGKVCEKAGVLFALQEEYSDMWADFEKFNERFLARDAEGAPVAGYLNARAPLPENQKARVIKPELVLKFAADEGKRIARGYETSAAYLGRHSSSPLSRGIDFTEGETGAGMARHVFSATAELFKQERKVHGGPVLGNGGAHWIYSGLLDGASAQPGAGWVAKKGQELPLLVDFDLLRMHPLHVTFGMGGIEDWRMGLSPGATSLPWGDGTPMIVLDQYRMQSLIFGHGSMLGGSLHDGEGLHWMEHQLVLPVARSYAAANPVEISYRVGGEWVDTSAAVLAQELSVVRVAYDNGLEITANGSEEKVELDGVVLPQFGWLARAGDGLLAYTALKDGVFVDYAKTADGIFANARRMSDWGDMIHFAGFTEPRGSVAAWKALHLNDGTEPVDFGGVKTDGSMSLRREENEWILTTYPVGAQFEVLLDGKVFRAPYEVVSTGGAEKSAKVEKVEGGWWKIALNGAYEYRFPAAR